MELSFDEFTGHHQTSSPGVVDCPVSSLKHDISGMSHHMFVHVHSKKAQESSSGVWRLLAGALQRAPQGVPGQSQAGRICPQSPVIPASLDPPPDPAAGIGGGAPPLLLPALPFHLLERLAPKSQPLRTTGLCVAAVLTSAAVVVYSCYSCCRSSLRGSRIGMCNYFCTSTHVMLRYKYTSLPCFSNLQPWQPP